MKHCPNCNAYFEDAASFCADCGLALVSEPVDALTAEAEAPQGEPPLYEDDPATALESAETISPAPQEDAAPQTPKKPFWKQYGVLIASITCILLVCVAVGAFQIKGLLHERQLRSHLSSLMGSAESFEDWAADTEDRFERYPLVEKEETTYRKLTKTAKALNGDDLEKQISCVEQMTALEDDVLLRLEDAVEAAQAEIANKEIGYASEGQKKVLEDYNTQLSALSEAQEYKQFFVLCDAWRTYAEEAARKKEGYKVEVMQHDFTAYPTVKLYVNVLDESTGALVPALSPNMFFVSEKTASGTDFLKRTIKKAVKMNENERLNINLLADISGSMDGGNMESARHIIKSFLGTVQYDAGDRVKLTPFNSLIDKSGVFSGDLSSLTQQVDSYDANGETKLYDAIIYGVQDVSAQEGAKCVLAFTDGMDVGSYNSASEVVDVVSRYNIPVFIVRIGGSANAAEDSALQRIAQASGGSFKNLSQFSMDMTSFYNQIYRQLKEYYVVEYDTTAEQNLTAATDISLYIQNDEQGGESEVQVRPGQEMLDTLLGSFLRSYIMDMDARSYGNMKPFVDDTVDASDKYSIQWQMNKQVTGGFSQMLRETLMDYQITDVTLQDENTILLRTNENYDVIYDETYGHLAGSERDVAKSALQYMEDHGLGTPSSETAMYVWAKLNQKTEYILKRGADGKWRFSRYAKPIKAVRNVYYVEILWF